ncbi:MAG: hemerythrin domain-containing protein [Nitrospirota bacterium]
MNAITNFMGQDHDRLEGLVTEFQATKGSDLGKAKHFFSEFKRGLQRHIVWEEEILFPLFEHRTGMEDRGPTAVMRTEHRQIKDFLEQIHDRIAKGETNTDEFERGLLTVLSAHNQKEETILYPWIDQSLSEQEAKETLARMREVPEEQYHHCCG